MDILQLIKDYGDLFYLITFVWTFFEGETFVIFAGFAASQDILVLEYLILAAWFGSFFGDQLYFWLGRNYGARLLDRFPRWRMGVDLARDWLYRYNTWFILSFRFIYLVRNFSSFAIGMSGISWPRFAALNFIAAGVWAVTFAGTGYILGETLEAVLGDLALGFGLTMLVIFLLALWFTTARHRQARALATAAAVPPPPATKDPARTHVNQ